VAFGSSDEARESCEGTDQPAVRSVCRSVKLARAGKPLPGALALLTSMSTKHSSDAIYLDFTLHRTSGTLRHSHFILPSLVETQPSRYTTRLHTSCITHRHLVTGAPCNAIVRSARRYISLRVHSSHCIQSIPRPPIVTQHHVLGRRLARAPHEQPQTFLV
jgi:hypothetical protein